MELIIRTEERPKKSTLATILNTLYSTYLTEKDINIIPIFYNPNIFSFKYNVNINFPIREINTITLEIVSGSSSFIDYLIFEKHSIYSESLIAMFEETKTDDSESRNTGVYQRASKFVYANLFFPDIPKYMLYVNENNQNKNPSETAQFGTKLLKTIGVNIIGNNDYYNKLTPFYSVDEIIYYKNNMKKPPKNNTPIIITKNLKLGALDSYSISGILSKPKTEGNIANDPNIGALTLISAGIRVFDQSTPIYITNHYVSQTYINKIHGNKFLYIANLLNIKLFDLVYNPNIFINNKPYYHEEHQSEKITTIFLHILLENIKSRLLYENHAGCERGYFYTKENNTIALPKKIHQQKLYIPDLIMQLPSGRVLIIEGKKLSTLPQGIRELNNYDLIENEYIKPSYDYPNTERWVTTFGGNIDHLDKKVLIHINDNGSILINQNAPIEIKNIFNY